MGSHKIEYRCSLLHGLHARPATQLEAFCKRFSATIDWCNQRNGRCANAKSVLALLGTDTLYDDLCEITLSGKDAGPAASALLHFLRHEMCEETDAEPEPESCSIRVPRSLRATQSLLVHGTAVSPGIGRGQLVVLDTIAPVLPADLRPERLSRRQQLLQNALTRLQQQLLLQLQQAKAQTAPVLQAHLSLVSDCEFQQALQRLLPEVATVAQAILQVQQHFQTQFLASASGYLQERELDLRDVCQQLLALLYPEWAQKVSLTLNTASVVLADELTPSEFLQLDKRYLQALLLTHAGQTSHTIILARAANIPVLTGLTDSRVQQAAGQVVIADAELGICLLKPDAIAERYYALYAQVKQQRWQQLQQQSLLAGCSADQQRLEIAANITSVTDAQNAFQAGAEEIGLFRTEMLFMERDAPPDEEEQYQVYRAVLQAAEGKPVIIRTFDIGGDKPVDYLPFAAELNPYLGLRGVRLYPYCEVLFRTQLRALLRAASDGPLKVMLPMVSQPEELLWVRQLITEEESALHAVLIPHASFSLGIMLEVPAAALQLRAFCPLADFFSIGSNDLTQYLLAVDRNNPRVAGYYHYAHPALWLLLQQLVIQAHQHGRWVGLCGELSSDRRFLPLLLGLGLNEISLSSARISECKTQLSQLHAGRCRQLLRQVCGCENSEQVLSLLATSQVSEPRPILSTENMILQSDWRNKEEVLKGIVDHLWLTGRTSQPLQLEETLWTREEAYSTGLGHGIAIPHAMTDVIDHPAISICRLAHPVDWGSLDGQPVDLVIMLTLSTRQGREQHLRIFSRLARRIMYEEFCQQLRTAGDEQALCELLQQELNM
ncbi:MAG: phosphoenolpyruvate--protein phosphotransferase [Gammaproteobacteria bacterium]|nr:phosphoenolpyruvate--protein phosphotransferase [Gammaproteobacteria bacterium]